MNAAIKIVFIFLFSANISAQVRKPVSIAAYDINKKYGREQLQFDLAIMKTALTTCHPGLYWHQTKEELDRKYLALQQSVNRDMTEVEFLALLTPFFAGIRCDHTNLEMSAAFFDMEKNTSTKVFPFTLKVLGSVVYIIGDYSSEGGIQKGSQILSVNDLPADSISRHLKRFGWADGYTPSMVYLNIEPIVTPLLLSMFGQGPYYHLKIREPDGQVKNLQVGSVPYKTFREKLNASQSHHLSPLYEHFLYKEIDSLETAMIKIDAFIGNGFYDFLKSSFDTLNARKIPNLIIDLRGNGGGEGEYTGPFYRRISLHEYKDTREVETKIRDSRDTILRYCQLPDSRRNFNKFLRRYVYQASDGRYLLKYHSVDDFQEKPFPPRKDAYQGNVYILTDAQTSSAGSWVATMAHYNKRATIIGRETGGGYNGNSSGWDMPFTLPNSKIIIHVPLFKFTFYAKGLEHRGVPPDYPVEENIQDLITGRDADLLLTYDLIRKHRINSGK